MREEGADAWWTRPAEWFLGPAHAADDYEQVTDILDVWFDSGSTHAFVTEARLGAEQADLYLEGSDQHRGWFQSSLLEACGTRGRPPYRGVLTHGFALDERGRKMSKSLGNVVDPLKLIADSGADVLRLWCGSADFTEDVRLGKATLQTTIDSYRKLRNTLRYLLGALDGWTGAEAVAPETMPELERYLLSLLAGLDAELRAAAERHAYNHYTAAILAFVNQDLSAFLFDVRKDSLYCDRPDAPRRRAFRTTMSILFQALVRFLAPILAFTAEEAWEHWGEHRGEHAGGAGSVHHQTWLDIPAAWRDPALEAKFARLRALRSLVNQEIERARRAGTIGASTEAAVLLTLPAADAAGFDAAAFAELAIIASVRVQAGAAEAAEVSPSTDPRCERCWQHLPDVAPATGLCGRCADAVAATATVA
jgi:isoleucyl-tRNA synthetase